MENSCLNCRHCHQWDREETKVYEDRRVGPFWRRRTERWLVSHIVTEGGMQCTLNPLWVNIYEQWHWCSHFEAAQENRPFIDVDELAARGREETT